MDAIKAALLAEFGVAGVVRTAGPLEGHSEWHLYWEADAGGGLVHKGNAVVRKGHAVVLAPFYAAPPMDSEAEYIAGSLATFKPTLK